MKIIPKFQSGGSFDSFFTIYQPIGQPASLLAGSSSKKKDTSDDDEKGKLTEKDLMSMLKESVDLLPNESTLITNELMLTLLLSNLTGRSVLSLSTMYLKSLNKINNAKYNKAKYDEAYKKAEENGSMGEVAITPDGKIMVTNIETKLLNKISLAEYLHNKESYEPMSVSNLLNLRAFTPSMAFLGENTIFNIALNSVGFQSFLALLLTELDKLGKSKLSYEGLFSVKLKKVISGVELLQSLRQDDRIRSMNSVSADGLYEYGIVDENQMENIKIAVDYLSKLMPESIKTYAGFKLQTPKKEEALKQLITTYFVGGSDKDHDFDIEYKGSMLKVSKGENDEANDIKLDTALKFQVGYGEHNIYNINMGSSRQTIVMSTQMPLVNKDGHNYGSMKDFQTITEGQFGKILDLKNASIGLNHINSTYFNLIIVKDGMINAIDFPSTVVGDRIVPDVSLKTQDAKNKAETTIKNMGINLNSRQSIILNVDAINQAYINAGLKPRFLKDGSTNPLTWTRFAVMDIYTDERVLGPEANKSFVKEVTDDYTAESIISEILKSNKNYISTRDDWFGSSALFEATLWIPIKQDKHIAAADLRMETDQAYQLEREQLEDRRLNLIIINEVPSAR